MSVTAKHHFPQALADGIVFLSAAEDVNSRIAKRGFTRYWCGFTHVSAWFLPLLRGFVPLSSGRWNSRPAQELRGMGAADVLSGVPVR